MSTHADASTTSLGRPRLVRALLEVALISTWRGRTFLDDNAEFGDIAGFTADSLAAPVPMPAPRPAPKPRGGHSAAA